MASFNKAILMGRLTADPELKQTPSGVTVTSFSLAVDRKVKDAPCDFITIVAWRQTAEFICKYFKKGQAMLVCGEIQTRSWKDSQGNKRTATEVVASEVNFCEAKNNSEGNSLPQYQNGSQGKFKPPAFEDLKTDEDLPF
jgi:single-strand DNA-binding protein